MTDQELADAVRKACAALNEAIFNANAAGLEVKAEVFDHRANMVRGDIISVTVRKIV